MVTGAWRTSGPTAWHPAAGRTRARSIAIPRSSGPQAGAPAPDFSLDGVAHDHDRVVRRRFSLGALRGRPVVAVFYPGDETGVCTEQLCAYSDAAADFDALGATVVAINAQDLDSHERFVRRAGIRIPLLSDERRDVADAYGVRLAGRGVRRAVFIIDAEGIVRYRHVALAGGTFRSVPTLTEQLARLVRSA